VHCGLAGSYLGSGHVHDLGRLNLLNRGVLRRSRCRPEVNGFADETTTSTRNIPRSVLHHVAATGVAPLRSCDICWRHGAEGRWRPRAHADV
jgi:hypothetical protein